MYTATLRRLEGSSLVTRAIIPAVPLHVEYELTGIGRSLAIPLAALPTWAEKHLDEISHAAASLDA